MNDIKPKKTSIFNDKSKRAAFSYTIRNIIGTGILAACTAMFVAERVNQGNQQVNVTIAVLAVGFLLYFTSSK